ncbi:MAG: hypothetical protein ACO1QR_10980 [Chthoniobacteraceae bacterium]
MHTIAFAMDVLFPVAFCLVSLAVLKLFIDWALKDAAARGKPGWLVALVVVFFLPLGWLHWLLFRPPLLPPKRREFDLQSLRVQ